jgi:DNA repair exonuclease SbcCD ATPase subunit
VPGDAGEAFELLSGVLSLSVQPVNVDAVDGAAEAERLSARRAELREALRDVNDKIRGLDEFSRVGTEYGAELNEHRVRLASVGLIPDTEDTEAICPVCASSLGDTAIHEAITHSLGRIARRIELAQRDQPRITASRAQLIEARDQTRTELADVDAALDELARTDDIQAAAQRTWEQQRGLLHDQVTVSVTRPDRPMWS